MAKTYTVERSISIDADPADVYAQIADLRNWVTWSPWEGLDPELERTYTGAESGTGASYAWSGNKKAGAGSMTIIEATEPSDVRIDLEFEKPFPARNDTRFRIEPDGLGSTVTWTMKGALNPIMRVVQVVYPMDKMIGPDFEKGLAQLKAHLEPGQQ
ncbi:SRPBCC family protein [Ornithinimicrobium sp. Y1847]|uniref:SRPBCC family protein n=1 Tax=unclassified Ornithinimicrobium TaxID=2615080 RepID=UPI003B67FB13